MLSPLVAALIVSIVAGAAARLNLPFTFKELMDEARARAGGVKHERVAWFMGEIGSQELSRQLTGWDDPSKRHLSLDRVSLLALAEEHGAPAEDVRLVAKHFFAVLLERLGLDEGAVAAALFGDVVRKLRMAKAAVVKSDEQRKAS